MGTSETGIEALAARLRRKAQLTASHYRREKTIDAEADWPRDAEIALIESLVRARAMEVTGNSEIPAEQWRPCREFAHEIQLSRRGPDERGPKDNEARQRQYELSEADFFDGIVLWVDHTIDCLGYLSEFGARVVSKQCILFLAANPSDTTRLRLDRELREVRDEMERAGCRERFDLQARGAVRPKDIVRSMIDLEPTYVHFSGHGSSDGAICTENETGSTHEIAPDALASLFAASGESVQCVLLNACFSEKQAAAIAQHVPYVVGMKTTISDDAAIAFATGFYRAIGAGKSVPIAFRLGLVELRLHAIPEADTPVLIPKGNLVLQPIN